jgi:hypothetical protein
MKALRLRNACLLRRLLACARGNGGGGNGGGGGGAAAASRGDKESQEAEREMALAEEEATERDTHTQRHPISNDAQKRGTRARARAHT